MNEWMNIYLLCWCFQRKVNWINYLRMFSVSVCVCITEQWHTKFTYKHHFWIQNFFLGKLNSIFSCLVVAVVTQKCSDAFSRHGCKRRNKKDTHTASHFHSMSLLIHVFAKSSFIIVSLWFSSSFYFILKLMERRKLSHLFTCKERYMENLSPKNHCYGNFFCFAKIFHVYDVRLMSWKQKYFDKISIFNVITLNVKNPVKFPHFIDASHTAQEEKLLWNDLLFPL